MHGLLGWIVVLAVLMGHLGLHLGIYNRLNASRLSRRHIKQIEKLFVATMLIIPPLAIWLYPQSLGSVLAGRLVVSEIPPVLLVYSLVCLSSGILLGIPWLMWRPIWGLEWVEAPRTIAYYDVEEELDRSLARSAKCQLESRFPFNQIFHLSVEQIRLPVVGLPEELAGYRIAHLSDIHLTGDIEPDYTAFVIAKANEWQPDLFALTGDVIDKQPCIDWLAELFSPAACPDGCYFILGNHDTRVPDPDQTRRQMEAAGWIDLGGRVISTQLHATKVQLIGNEYPWFPRPELAPGDPCTFRMLLSHSPDQLSWARRHNVQLMLAGHTHGGQGRLPLAGPLLSPSWHGSRYASGDFYKPPTTLHVSRGLAGVHLLRLRCPPELSLIELQPA